MARENPPQTAFLGLSNQLLQDKLMKGPQLGYCRQGVAPPTSPLPRRAAPTAFTAKLLGLTKCICGEPELSTQIDPQAPNPITEGLHYPKALLEMKAKWLDGAELSLL